jgi:hypothetical protein
MKKLVFGLIATVMFGFVGNAQGLRAAFLQGKTQDQITKTFRALTPQQKNALWVEKMDQLLTQKLPTAHITKISALKALMIKNVRTNLADFITPAIGLVSITPEDDFIKMFESLYDYNYVNGKFIGTNPVSANIIASINKLGTPPASNTGGTAARACNCNWTCSLYATNSSVCVATIDGCGFLGFSPCDGWV